MWSGCPIFRSFKSSLKKRGDPIPLLLMLPLASQWECNGRYWTWEQTSSLSSNDHLQIFLCDKKIVNRVDVLNPLFAWLTVSCSFVRKVRQFWNAVETGQLPLHACLANKWPTWMEFVWDFEIASYLFKVAFLLFNLSLLTFCYIQNFHSHLQYLLQFVFSCVMVAFTFYNVLSSSIWGQIFT